MAQTLASSTMAQTLAIGIDLGTTYSCVGIVQNGRVNIIYNESGPRITPSYVAFNEEEHLVGTAAKKQSMSNPENTIFQVKRIIGKRFHDSGVQGDIKLWPFKVRNYNDAIQISVQYQNNTRNYVPEEISAMVLGKMKALAESYVGDGKVVTDAVITVPAYFNDSQRQATIDAGKIAGLNVMTLLNEPTAAAIAYGFDKEVKNDCNILIYDFGGGTFDVAVLSLSRGKIEVKAVGGNSHLGGADLDNRLLNFFLDFIRQKYKKDLSNNARALGRLRDRCEDLKINLSEREATTIEIDALFDGKDFKAPLTRTRFEDLCSDLFEQTIDQMKVTLLESGLQKEAIAEVILVGGSTRIPKIQELVQKFFEGKNLNKSINPDEVVAYGAALEAANLSRDSSIDDLILVDVMPFSLSVGVGDGRVERIIAKNTKLPTRVTEPFTTNYENQTVVRFSIYEGERDYAAQNNHLGTFRLENIQIAPRGEPNISLTYEVDVNGILHASAIDHTTKSANEITIIATKGRLCKEEIEEMIVERKSLEEDSKRRQKRMKARSALELYCSDQIKITRGIIGAEWVSERQLVRQLCLEAQSWVDQYDEATDGDYVKKLNELRLKCSPVIARMRSH